MTNPAIVLVHGAFGDASNWRRVFDYLGAIIDQLHTELDGASHFGVMLSEPDVVAGVIREAALTIAAEWVA